MCTGQCGTLNQAALDACKNVEGVSFDIASVYKQNCKLYNY